MLNGSQRCVKYDTSESKSSLLLELELEFFDKFNKIASTCSLCNSLNAIL